VADPEPLTELGAFSSAIREGKALVYRIDPTTAFGFGKGTSFSQTRWRFEPDTQRR
jgi:hypothetical protein